VSPESVKARSPKVDQQVDGTANDFGLAEHRWRPLLCHAGDEVQAHAATFKLS